MSCGSRALPSLFHKDFTEFHTGSTGTSKAFARPSSAFNSRGDSKAKDPLLQGPDHGPPGDPWESQAIAGGGTQRVSREHKRKHSDRLMLLPELTEIDLEAETDFKRRGLFKVLIYGLSGTIRGRFELPAEPQIERKAEGSHITWGQPFLSLSITDTRGLSRAPMLSWDGAELGFERRSNLRASTRPGICSRVWRWRSSSCCC